MKKTICFVAFGVAIAAGASFAGKEPAEKADSEPSGIITSVGSMTTARSKRINSLREKYKALLTGVCFAD